MANGAGGWDGKGSSGLPQDAFELWRTPHVQSVNCLFPSVSITGGMGLPHWSPEGGKNILRSWVMDAVPHRGRALHWGRALQAVTIKRAEEHQNCEREISKELVLESLIE